MEEQIKPDEQHGSPAKDDAPKVAVAAAPNAAASQELVRNIYDALKRLKKAPPDREMSEGDAATVKELLRSEYAHRLDLYKHYMTVAVSFNVLYYGVTGAVVSSTLGGGRLRAGGLLLPLVMSVFFAIVLIKAYWRFCGAEADIKNMARASGFECEEVSVLRHILKYSSIMFVFNSTGLLVLMVLKFCGLLPE